MANYALRFNAATSDRAQGTLPAAADGLTTWTSLVLVCPTSLVGNRMIFAKGAVASGNSRVETRLQSAGTGDLQTILSHATTPLNYRTTSTPLASLNRWYWIATICDLNAGTAKRVRWFVAPAGGAWKAQTVSVPNEPAGSPSPDTGAGIVIGNNTAAVLAFPGSIAFAALSNVVLSLEEIEAIRQQWTQQNVAANFRGRLGVWAPGIGSTTAVVDLSGNGTTLTVTGAALVPCMPEPLGPRRLWERMVDAITSSSPTVRRFLTLLGVS